MHASKYSGYHLHIPAPLCIPAVLSRLLDAGDCPEASDLPTGNPTVQHNEMI